MSNSITNLGNLLPSQVTVTSSILPNLNAGGPGVGAPSYFDLEITDANGILNGAFDAFCIDVDLPLGFNGFDLDNDGVYGETGIAAPSLSDALGVDPNTLYDEGNSQPFSANVYSSYDPAVINDGLGGIIEHPENLDLVNWILNNTGTGNALASFTTGEIQLAIWQLMDDDPPSSDDLLGLEAFSNGFDQANVDQIKTLAQQNGEGFVPEQPGDKVAVILVPDNNGDGIPDGQIIVTTVDLSEFKGSIGDTVFQDENADGVQNNGEAGIAGVTVDLIDKGADGELGGGDDTVVDTQTTDANGNYLFENVVTGNYAVQVTDVNNVLDGLEQTADPDAVLDNMSMVDLAPGENNLDQDFGYDAPTGSIGDTIFRDDNANGVQDAGEAGISGVEVRLTDKG
ncbi:MAG: SdrD B-like domain-containing protein, partial [Okeania sp.]|nr:SdrD B-like domain-containing protein [Okeania sp.]